MKTCKLGHNYDKDKRICPECRKTYITKYNKEKPEKTRLASAKWQSLNPMLYKAAKKKHYESNLYSERYKRQLWCTSNSDKNVLLKKEWRKNNLGKCAAHTAKRRAIILQATPPWLTKDHLAEIEEFYVLAQELAWLNQDVGVFHVDHIVPLQGENVSGLHVPWNLQLLSASENLSKGNKL